MDEFDSLQSDELKVKYLFNLLSPVADRIAGNIRDVKTEYEVQCTGKYEKRPVKIIMDESTGGLKVELKLKNSTGTININYDPDAGSGGGPVDPDWDSGADQRFFIEPCFYLEDYPGVLEKQKRVLEMIDPGVLENIKTLMKKLGIGWVNVNASVLSCGLFESLFNADEILGIIDALQIFALQFEKGGEQVEPEPSVILDGIAVNTELIGELMVCPYCKCNVSVKSDRKCPNCGAGL